MVAGLFIEALLRALRLGGAGPGGQVLAAGGTRLRVLGARSAVLGAGGAVLGAGGAVLRARGGELGLTVLAVLRGTLVVLLAAVVLGTTKT